MDNKQYTVQEFVEKYKKANDIEKTKLFKEIGIKTYLPYAEKVVYSENVLSQSAKRINGVLQHNSSKRFLVYATSILKLYTNLQLNKEAPHEDYDMMKQCGAMDDVINKIGDDIHEFTTVFNMTWDDMLKNENDWRVFIASQFNSFVDNVAKNMQDDNIRKLFSNSGIFKQ